MDSAIKFCIVCGRKIPANSMRRKLCSDRCTLKRKQLLRHGQVAPFESCAEPPLQSKTLGEINAEARKQHMTYGQYMAKLSDERRRKSDV